MNKKKIVILVIVAVVVILGIVIINKKDNNDINQVVQNGETTNKIATKKENDKFEIYNTDIKTDKGETKIIAKVKNKTASGTEEQRITIELLDKQGKVIGEMKILVPSLEAGRSVEVVSESLTVYEGINDFRIK